MTKETVIEYGESERVVVTSVDEHSFSVIVPERIEVGAIIVVGGVDNRVTWKKGNKIGCIAVPCEVKV